MSQCLSGTQPSSFCLRSLVALSQSQLFQSVLEKNDCEDCCGDQEERSGDIVFHVIFNIFGIYCHYADVKIKIKTKSFRLRLSDKVV